jgi:hypothetical protein
MGGAVLAILTLGVLAFVAVTLVVGVVAAVRKWRPPVGVRRGRSFSSYSYDSGSSSDGGSSSDSSGDGGEPSDSWSFWGGDSSGGGDSGGDGGGDGGGGGD